MCTHSSGFIGLIINSSLETKGLSRDASSYQVHGTQIVFKARKVERLWEPPRLSAESQKSHALGDRATSWKGGMHEEKK